MRGPLLDVPVCDTPAVDDVQPAAKAAAVEAVQTRLRAGKQSVVEIIDAQYGGILSSSASVLVPVRQWTLGSGGRITQGGTTVDVRLVRRGGCAESRPVRGRMRRVGWSAAAGAQSRALPAALARESVTVIGSCGLGGRSGARVGNRERMLRPGGSIWRASRSR